jgi:hypothetical protein
MAIPGSFPREQEGELLSIRESLPDQRATKEHFGEQRKKERF